MKKMFLRISRILLVAFVITMLVLIAFAVADADGEIEMPGILLPLCVLVILAAGVCGVIAFVLAVWEGWKKNRMGLLKTLVTNYIVIGIGFAFVKLTDGTGDLDIPKLLLQILVPVCGILAGEYILSRHED